MGLEHESVFQDCVVNVLPLNALENEEKISYDQVLAKRLCLLAQINSRRRHLYPHLFEVLMELLFSRPRRSLSRGILHLNIRF